MSTIHGPPPSVAFDGELMWILKEPVTVMWRDPSIDREFSLGQSTPTGKIVPLTLWVGENKGQNRLVIMLQLTMTHYVSSRKKTMNFFLMPSLDLRIDGQGDFDPVALRDLPPPIRDKVQQANPDLPGHKRLLLLSMAQTSSQVMMPVRKASDPKPIQGTAVHLLFLLKSLSETTRFDTCIDYSSYTKTALWDVRNALELGQFQPAINLRRMYDSNGGAYNSWEHYLDLKPAHGARENNPEQSYNPTRKRARRGSYPRLGKEQGDLLPPPYPEPRDHLCGEGCVDPGADIVKVLIPESDHCYTPRSLDHGMASDVVPATPLQSKSPICSDAPAKPLPVVHDAQGEPPISRDVPELSLSLQPSSPHLPLAANLLPINHGGHVPNTLHQSLTRWLYEMKKMDPNVHQVPELFTFLIAFGVAVQKGDVARFINIKAKCTSMVLKEHNRAEPSHNESKVTAPERRVQSVIRWICGLILDAETAMMDELKTLSQKASALAERIQDHPSTRLPEDQQQSTADLDDAEKDYLFQEAKCISNFCVTYGRILAPYREKMNSRVS